MTDENFLDLGDGIMRIIATMIVVGLVMASCSYINKKLGIEDDNIAEELAEDIIEMKTGMEIDLTPSSPEK